MRIPVADAMSQILGRGLVKRFRNPEADEMVSFVQALIGRRLPEDLIDFYQEGIADIGDYGAVAPAWKDHLLWRVPDELFIDLLEVNAVPLFYDGCGNRFALDITPGVETPAVYFFEWADDDKTPAWAAGSSLGAFLLLAADHHRAFKENWPDKWELKIDPDIDKCPRARAIWAAG